MSPPPRPVAGSKGRRRAKQMRCGRQPRPIKPLATGCATRVRPGRPWDGQAIVVLPSAWRGHGLRSAQKQTCVNQGQRATGGSRPSQKVLFDRVVHKSTRRAAFDAPWIPPFWLVAGPAHLHHAGPWAAPPMECAQYVQDCSNCRLSWDLPKTIHAGCRSLLP